MRTAGLGGKPSTNQTQAGKAKPFLCLTTAYSNSLTEPETFKQHSEKRGTFAED